MDTTFAMALQTLIEAAVADALNSRKGPLVEALGTFIEAAIVESDMVDKGALDEAIESAVEDLVSQRDLDEALDGLEVSITHR